MEKLLTFDEVQILDNIIYRLYNNGGLKINQLPRIDKTNKENYDTYEYYFKRLRNDELIETSNTVFSQPFDIYPIETALSKFYENGGYKQIYEDQQKEIEHHKELKELTLKKLQWDSKLSKWQANTFWYVFLFGLIGGICGIISLIISFYK